MKCSGSTRQQRTSQTRVVSDSGSNFSLFPHAQMLPNILSLCLWCICLHAQDSSYRSLNIIAVDLGRGEYFYFKIAHFFGTDHVGYL